MNSGEQQKRPKINLVSYYVIISINLLICLLTCLAAFGGYFDPKYLKAIPAMAAMSFPVWVFVVPVLLIIDLFTFRRLCFIPIVTIALCYNAFLDFCPLNFGSKEKNPDNLPEFSLLTYNVFNFTNFKDLKTEDGGSLTAQTIIDSHADIVCLQEGVDTSVNLGMFSKKQSDSLKNLYPYRAAGTPTTPVFSIVPVEVIPIQSIPGTTGQFTNYRLTIDGKKLSIYNVHLQSIGLNDSDKELYRDLTKGKAESISTIRHSLLSKLVSAFKARADQARLIRQRIDNDSTENIIVCGDFNDVPGCYAMREIMGRDMKNAYRERACGPSITYRDNRFYFHIDQILYKGNIDPVRVETIKEGNSDHFPVFAKFRFKSKESES